MRWKIKPTFKFGDKRVVEKYLYFPLELEREVRWLEKCKIEQYRGFNSWRNHKWIDD